MSQKITINPSIATILNINWISVHEVVPIYFTASTNWNNNHIFSIWSSDEKINKIEIQNSPISIFENVMTLTINPIEQKIPAGKFYYEIIDNTSHRIIFKGEINILK